MVESPFGSARTFAHLYVNQWAGGAEVFAQEPIHEKLEVYALRFFI